MLLGDIGARPFGRLANGRGDGIATSGLADDIENGLAIGDAQFSGGVIDIMACLNTIRKQGEEGSDAMDSGVFGAGITDVGFGGDAIDVETQEGLGGGHNAGPRLGSGPNQLIGVLAGWNLQ